MHRFDQTGCKPEDLKPPSALSGRKGSKKVRSGCITCKIRKVKCDEAKPYCLRCTKTGRKCDGYLDAAALAIRRRRRRRTASSSLAGSLAGAQSPVTAANVAAIMAAPGSIPPSAPLLSWASHQEKRSFEFFHHITAPSLAGDLDAVFWRVLVLQICHTEPAVRHAVLAISSLHEAFLRVPSASTAKISASSNLAESPTLLSADVGTSQPQEFALQQYNKAIAHLLNDMKVEDKEKGDDDGVEETIEFDAREHTASVLQRPVAPLMTCVLFVCIEVMQGKDKEALIHLEQGRHIISRLDPKGTAGAPRSVRTKARDTDSEMAVVRQHLVPLYTRLSMTSFLFGGSPVPIPSSLKTTDADRIPGTFDSIHALRAAIHDSLDAVLRFTQRARPSKYPMSSTSPSPSPSILSPSPSPPSLRTPDDKAAADTLLHALEAERQRLSTQLSRLRVALSLFRVNQSTMATATVPTAATTTTTAKATSPNVAAMALLQIHLCIAEIWLATALTRAETAYDAHVETFSTIISLATTVLDAEQQQQQQQQQHRPWPSSSGSTVPKTGLQQQLMRSAPHSVFTLETHVIPALYYVATKCRHGLVRHAALALLARNGGRRENLWRADVLSAIAAQIIKIEEGHAAAKRDEDGEEGSDVKEEEEEEKGPKEPPQMALKDKANELHIPHGREPPSQVERPLGCALDPLGFALNSQLADPLISATAMAMDGFYGPVPSLGQWDFEHNPEAAVPWAAPSSRSEVGPFSASSASDEDGIWGGQENFLMDDFCFFGETETGENEGNEKTGGEDEEADEVSDEDMTGVDPADEPEQENTPPAQRPSRPTPAGSDVEHRLQAKLSVPSPSSSSFSFSSKSASPPPSPTLDLRANQETTEPPFNVPECARVHTTVIGPEEAKGRWVTLFRKPHGLEGAWDVQAEFVCAAA